MEWASFFGALAGAIAGVLIVVAILAAWSWWSEEGEPPSPIPISSILERQLEWYIVGQFDILFPGWKIYDPPEITRKSKRSDWPLGVQYPIGGNRKIDILCTDTQGDFVVIEIKRGKAPDRPPKDVVSQIGGYISWVKENLARGEQNVRGLIIAKNFSIELYHNLSNKPEIQIWAYDWLLQFDKNPKPTL